MSFVAQHQVTNDTSVGMNYTSKNTLTYQKTWPDVQTPVCLLTICSATTGVAARPPPHAQVTPPASIPTRALPSLCGGVRLDAPTLFPQNFGSQHSVNFYFTFCASERKQNDHPITVILSYICFHQKKNAHNYYIGWLRVRITRFVFSKFLKNRRGRMLLREFHFAKRVGFVYSPERGQER